MSEQVIRPTTAAEYRELPENGPRFQLIEGDLEMAPAPNTPHQIISSNIELMLRQWTDAHPGDGVVFHAPIDVYLTDISVFQPDVVFIAARHRSIIRKDGLHGGPDLVVEILSPSTGKFDLGPKKRVYSKTGVAEMWIIDPESERTTVYDLRTDADMPILTLEKGDTFRSGLLEGLEIDTASFFRGMEWISE